MFSLASEKTFLAMLVLTALAISGCGNAAAEQATFRKIKELGGKLEVHGNGPEIIFSSAGIKDDDLACLDGLNHVHELTLENVEITDKGLEHLLKLDQLDMVRIRRTKITEEGIGKLQKRFPDILVNR
jgi:hypothetical protein